MLIVSPHLDDAALSLGRTIAGHAGSVTVLTIFAGTPPAGTATAYDAARGFLYSVQAMGARRAEDVAAWAEYGNVMPIHGDELDAQYRQSNRELADRIDAKIEFHARWRRQHVCVPLGLGHPDHRWVADAAMGMRTAHEFIVYEELPYKVHHPEEVRDRLQAWAEHGWAAGAHLMMPVGSEDEKIALLRRYESQLGDTTARRHDVLVPERTWRMRRA